MLPFGRGSETPIPDKEKWNVTRQRTIVRYGEATNSRTCKPLLRSIWDVLDEFVCDLENALIWQRRFRASRKPSVPAFSPTRCSPIRTATAPLMVADAENLPSSSWCRRFAEEQLKRIPSPRDSYCYFNSAPTRFDAEPRPRSTMMVRLNKSKSLWVVALSFSDQRLFRMEDVKIVLLIKRIFCDYRRQMRTR